MKSIDGIWTLEFYGAYGWEVTSIVMLEDGRWLGGGHNHYCKGTYEISGKTVTCRVRLDYFGKIKTLFGAKDKRLRMELVGKTGADEIAGEATRPDKQVIPLQFRLVRRTNLA